MSLLSYSTQAWAAEGRVGGYFPNSPTADIWLRDLSKLVGQINPTEVRITSILCQLSAAVHTGRALPPMMESSMPYQLSERLRELDPDVLRIKHMHELGYSAYAVMEIISSMITHNLDELTESVKRLVGVVNFDFEGLEDEDGKEGKTQ